MYEIEKKVVLVTGGAVGIGAGLVKAFLNGGAKHVAFLDIDFNNGETLEVELNNKHGPGRAKFYKCDVTTQDLDDAYQDIINLYGYIDVVVNNAGIMNDSPGFYEKMIAVNVTALIKSSLKAYNLMRVDGGGRGGTIINISSIVALLESVLMPVYGATKSAVLQFSSALGKHPHHTRSNVRVLTMCFGCTHTSLFSDTKMAAIDEETSELTKILLKKLPWQKPESAVQGVVEVFQKGQSGSTWLISSGKPAADITTKVKQAHEILSENVFD